MCRSIRTVVVVLFTLVLSPMALVDLAGQASSYMGTNVKATLVSTNSSAVTLVAPDAVNAFALLPGSILQVVMPPGDSDLFVFEIVAQCEIGQIADWADGVAMQARLNGLMSFAPLGGGRALLQPQDMPNGGMLCSGPGMDSVSKSWFVRLSGGESGRTWTFSIWWKLIDGGGPNPQLAATLDNQTVRLTRYD
jgi:hypothetical protein